MEFPHQILHVSFNRETDKFLCSYIGGVIVFRCDPYQQVLLRLDTEEIQAGRNVHYSIGRVVEMESVDDDFCRLALIGTRSDPDAELPGYAVLVFDQRTHSILAERAFLQEVVTVRVTSDVIVIVFLDFIVVFNFPDLSVQLHIFQAIDNIRGLCALSQTDPLILVYPPAGRTATLSVRRLPENRPVVNITVAESEEIASFAVSEDGEIVAVATTNRRVVRIFNLEDGQFLQQVTSADWTLTYPLAISTGNDLLAVSNQRGSIRIFRLKTNDPENDPENIFEAVILVEPEFVNEFRLRDNTRYIAAFSMENSLLAIDRFNNFFLCGEFGMQEFTYL